MIAVHDIGDEVRMMIATLLLAASLHAAPAVVSAPYDPKTSSHTDRKGRERGILAPTEVTLPGKTASLGLDELVWPKFSMGFTDRLQFSLSGMAIPFPFAAGGILPIPLPILIGGGGVGVGTVGLVDVGLKYKLVEEGSVMPGVAIGYEMVDAFAFGAGVGGGGAVGGNGVAAGVVPAVGGVNAQLNVVTLVTGKHFGAFHLMGGTYVIDNHNLLPQSAAVGGVVVAGGQGGVGTGTVGSSSRLGHLPTVAIPFAAGEYTIGPHASLMAEGFLFAAAPKKSFITTGARWVMREKGEPVFRIDAAAIWNYFEDAQVSSTSKQTVNLVLPSPWVSMSVYFG